MQMEWGWDSKQSLLYIFKYYLKYLLKGEDTEMNIRIGEIRLWLGIIPDDEDGYAVFLHTLPFGHGFHT